MNYQMTMLGRLVSVRRADTGEEYTNDWRCSKVGSHGVIILVRLDRPDAPPWSAYFDGFNGEWFNTSAGEATFSDDQICLKTKNSIWTWKTDPDPEPLLRLLSGWFSERRLGHKKRRG